MSENKRFLFVTPVPLKRELGAAKVVIELAGELRGRVMRRRAGGHKTLACLTMSTLAARAMCANDYATESSRRGTALISSTSIMRCLRFRGRSCRSGR